MPSAQAISAGDFPCSRIVLIVSMSCFFIWIIPPLNSRFCAWRPAPVVRPIALGMHTGLGVYSPGNLCEFLHSTQHPLSGRVGHRWIGPYPGLCVATCSKFFKIISIKSSYKNNLLFPATSCYKIYADRNSDAFTRYPRSSVVAPPPRLGRLRTTVANPRRAWLKFRLFSG